MKVPVFKGFKEIYDESGISTLFSDYVKRMAMFILVVFALTAISTTMVYNSLYHLPPIKLILVVFSLCLINTNIAAFAHLLYPLYRRNQVSKKIENSLIYAISYMNILAAGGSSIEKIMERVSEVEENPQIKQLASKFIIDMRFLGFDVTTALEDVSRRAPSKVLKKLLESINHNIRASGDLKNLFTYEMKRTFQRKMEGLKRQMRSLTYLGEMYVALLIVGPILFILMITILSVFSGSGTSSALQLNLIVFFGIPLLATAFAIILDTALEADE